MYLVCYIRKLFLCNGDKSKNHSSDDMGILLSITCDVFFENLIFIKPKVENVCFYLTLLQVGTTGLSDFISRPPQKMVLKLVLEGKHTHAHR